MRHGLGRISLGRHVSTLKVTSSQVDSPRLRKRPIVLCNDVAGSSLPEPGSRVSSQLMPSIFRPNERCWVERCAKPRGSATILPATIVQGLDVGKIRRSVAQGSSLQRIPAKNNAWIHHATPRCFGSESGTTAPLTQDMASWAPPNGNHHPRAVEAILPVTSHTRCPDCSHQHWSSRKRCRESA